MNAGQSENTTMDVDSMGDPIAVDLPVRAASLPYEFPNYRVGYVYSVEMMKHAHRDLHPDQPERISRIFNALGKAGLLDKMKRLHIRKVLKEEVLLVHSEEHWNKVMDFQRMTDQQQIDTEPFYDQLSLFVMQGTTSSALYSAGGAIEACLAVARGELKKSFAIVRPPGHHAEPQEHMGFCFFNNVAIATRVIQQLTPIKKILILDWDVHHGNGTQRAFYDDPSVLYISLHRYEGGIFYPTGSFGSLESCGDGEGLGYSVNVPWPEGGMGDADYLYAFQKIVMPIALEFVPEMVIISAGFDAAAGDDLGECDLTPVGYAHMTHMLCSLAGGRVAACLEGGYNLDALSQSAVAVTRVLLGESPEEIGPMTASELASETVWFVARQQSRFWKNVDPKACEPRTDVADSITFSIPEILKAHHHLYLAKEHDMMQVQLINEHHQERFNGQIMCTDDLFKADTMVVFVHEFGNLVADYESSTTCNVQMERSYLLDFSKDLINWIRKEGYSLLDVNLYPKPATTPLLKPKSSDDIGREVLTYLWDNYIQISEAQRVVMIGHGQGTHYLMSLIDKRSSGVMRQVKQVVQVCGHDKVPAVPKYSDELKQWYSKHSIVFVPSDHAMLMYPTKHKDIGRHGLLTPIQETQSMKLLMRALPAIKEVVSTVLSRDPLQNAMSRVNNA